MLIFIIRIIIEYNGREISKYPKKKESSYDEYFRLIRIAGKISVE